MTATLPVSELEAQIHALPFEDKVRIARFAQREIDVESEAGEEPPLWVQEELIRREKLVEEGLDVPQPWEEVRERLLTRFRK